MFRLANPRTGQFTMADRVGGKELDSTTIGRVRFGGGRVWAATNRGIWSHADGTTSGAWTFHYAPNMAYMPQITDDAGNVLVPARLAVHRRHLLRRDQRGVQEHRQRHRHRPDQRRHVIAALGLAQR